MGTPCSSVARKGLDQYFGLYFVLFWTNPDHYCCITYSTFTSILGTTMKTKFKNTFSFIRYFFRNAKGETKGAIVVIALVILAFLFWLGMADAIFIFTVVMIVLFLVWIVLGALFLLLMAGIETYRKWKTIQR